MLIVLDRLVSICGMAWSGRCDGWLLGKWDWVQGRQITEVAHMLQNSVQLLDVIIITQMHSLEH